MIISASRRTDIPAFFSQWFMNRVRAGYLLVRNAIGYHTVSVIPLGGEIKNEKINEIIAEKIKKKKIRLDDIVDCIVFWTKNPAPLLPHIDELSKKYGSAFYFQYTLNAYGRDVEANLPPLEKKLETFRCLSAKLGKERVIWRYDPILLTDKYTVPWHIARFEQMAAALSEATAICVFSFADMYANIKNPLAAIKARICTDEDMDIIAKSFSEIAKQYNLSLRTCAEKVDLERYGIEHNACIDRNLIQQIIGWELKVGKDNSQRHECQCVESADIGRFNTCRHGCRYCYANYNPSSINNLAKQHDPLSPFLIGGSEPGDRITFVGKAEHLKAKRLRPDPNEPEQASLFEFEE